MPEHGEDAHGRKTKQVICIRRDLKMRRGKEMAQASHAAMAFLTRKLNLESGSYNGQPTIWADDLFFTEAEKDWLENSFTKIVVGVNSEEELIEIHEKALAAEITSHLITDAGFTEFNGVPTKTAIAVGPWWSDELDQITKHLPLL